MKSKLSEKAVETIQSLVEKASPHKIMITDDLRKKLTFLRRSFVFHFVKDIDKKKDKEHYVETKIQQEKIFRKIKDYMYYEGKASKNPKDEVNKLEKLLDEIQIAVQYLRYINHTENLDKLLAERSMTISCRNLQDTEEVLSDPEVQSNISAIFNSANSVHSQICSESNSIKMDIFEELDDFLKYDAKTNKSGLKSSEFDKLVSLEAIKQKSEELAEKKLDSIEDSTLNLIDSKLNVQIVAQSIAGQSNN